MAPFAFLPTLHLPADEREAAAEFEQEALDVIDQSLLDLALPPRVRGAETTEPSQSWLCQDHDCCIRAVRATFIRRANAIRYGNPVSSSCAGAA